MHEMGHVLGVEHGHEDGLMASHLLPGQRKMPSPLAAHAIDDLLDDDPARLGELVRSGRGAHVHELSHARFPLLEVQGPVVERGGQPEAVFDEHFLSRSVAGVHPANLGDGLVALVDDDEGVGRQVIQQRRGRLAGTALCQVTRVVLDAVAVADLADHLEVEHRALVEPLRRELQRTEPGAIYAAVRPFQELVDPQLRPWRLGAVMFGLFGASGGPEQASDLPIAFGFRLLCKRQIACVRVALPVESSLQIVERLAGCW